MALVTMWLVVATGGIVVRRPKPVVEGVNHGVALQPEPLPRPPSCRHGSRGGCAPSPSYGPAARGWRIERPLDRGLWWHGEAAHADHPVFWQTEIQRHEDAVPMELVGLVDPKVAASPVRSARATTDFVLVCGGGGSEQAERRRAASGGGMEVGMDRVGAHRPHLYNARKASGGE